MTEEIKKENNEKIDTNLAAAQVVAKSVYGEKKKKFNQDRKGAPKRGEDDEFEQRIVDIARVTRVMAGGKRMRFRACVAIGNKKGKVGIGLAKGADVTMAVTKAVNDAKKHLIDVPMVNETIPHEILQKFGAALILLKPAKKGRGVIAGGVARIIIELVGIKNITSKVLGTNNKLNNAKCIVKALGNLKKGKKTENKENKENKAEDSKEDAEKVEKLKQDK